MAKFLDATGITHLVAKLKTTFALREAGTTTHIFNEQHIRGGVIPPTAPPELVLIDLSKVSYPAGQQFNQILQISNQYTNFGRYQGYIITGANTCIINPSFRTIYAGGGTVLAANSVYRYEHFGYNNGGGIFTCGFCTWQRLGAAQPTKFTL